MTTCPYCNRDSMFTRLDQGGDGEKFTERYFCNNCHTYFNKVYKLTYLYTTDVFGSKILRSR